MNSHGFTLVELTVVIAVLAIFVSLCLPAFSAERDLQLTLAVQQFVADLYQIQTLSECHGVASLQYWNEADRGRYNLYDNQRFLRQVSLPRQVYFGADPVKVEYGNGWPVAGYTLQLESPQSQYLQLVIVSLSTGRIRIVRQPRFPSGVTAHAR